MSGAGITQMQKPHRTREGLNKGQKTKQQNGEHDWT